MRDRLLQSRVRVRLIERTSVSSSQRLLSVSKQQCDSCTCTCARLDRSHTLRFLQRHQRVATVSSAVCGTAANPSLRSVRLSPKSQLRPTLAQRRCRRDAVSLALVFRPRILQQLAICRYSRNCRSLAASNRQSNPISVEFLGPADCKAMSLQASSKHALHDVTDMTSRSRTATLGRPGRDDVRELAKQTSTKTVEVPSGARHKQQLISSDANTRQQQFQSKLISIRTSIEIRLEPVRVMADRMRK